MFSALRPVTRLGARAFSTSSPKADVAKMTLVGRLVSDGLVRTNKNGKEFLVYKVVTTDPYVPPKEGETFVETSSWHSVFAYGPAIERIQKIERGSLVHCEANFRTENNKTDAGEFTTAIFAVHATCQVLRKPASHSAEAESSE